KGTDKFKIAPRRLIDRERRARRLADRRRQWWALSDLRALDVSDRGRRRCGLDARECAEGRGGLHAEERCQPPFGGRAVENVARERRHRRQRAQVRGKFMIGVERVRYDDL